jgi:uncharacterized protein
MPACSSSAPTVADPALPVEPSAARLHRAMRDAGALCLFVCRACHRAHHPPRALCPRCGSAGSRPEPVDPAGRVHSWTVVHRAALPPWRERAPYAVVLVELSGGARVLANALLETGPPAIGDVVTVAVRPEGPGRVGLWLA